MELRLFDPLAKKPKSNGKPQTGDAWCTGEAARYDVNEKALSKDSNLLTDTTKPIPDVASILAETLPKLKKETPDRSSVSVPMDVVNKEPALQRLLLSSVPVGNKPTW